MSPCGGGAAALAGAAESARCDGDTEGSQHNPSLATSHPKMPLGTRLPGMGRLSLPVQIFIYTA